MAHLVNLSCTKETLVFVRPRHVKPQRTRKRAKIIGFHGNAPDNLHEQEEPLLTTRRVALGLASSTLVASSSNGVSLAGNNGFWYDDDPLPVPSVENKIANEKTGTRSFLKTGIFIAEIGPKARMYRIKKHAFDLLSMDTLIGPKSLNYVRRYLRIKSSVMYFDFDRVISFVAESEKQPLTDLANRLFDNFEKLEDASKRKNLSETEATYQDTTVLLQEVMTKIDGLYYA